MIRGLLSVYQNESAWRWFSRKVYRELDEPSSDLTNSIRLPCWKFREKLASSGSWPKSRANEFIPRRIRVDFARVVFVWTADSPNFRKRVRLPRGYRITEKCLIDRIQKSFSQCALYRYSSTIHCTVDYAIIDWPLSNHRVAAFPK